VLVHHEPALACIGSPHQNRGFPLNLDQNRKHAYHTTLKAALAYLAACA
jgi:hypothetical protein